MTYYVWSWTLNPTHSLIIHWFDGLLHVFARLPVSTGRYVDATGSFGWSAAGTCSGRQLSTPDNWTTAANDELTAHYAGYDSESQLCSYVVQHSVNPLTYELPEHGVPRPGAPRHSIIFNIFFSRFSSQYFGFTGINQRPTGRYYRNL